MLKKLLCAAALLLPMTGSAQTLLQNESTTLYSLRTYLTQQSATQYLWRVEFRNEELYDPNVIYGITEVTMQGIPCCGPPAFTTSRHFEDGPVGHNLVAPTTRLDPAHPNDVFIPYDGGFQDAGINLNGVAQAGIESTSPFAGFGVLGCTAPVSWNYSQILYSGDTCAAAGFTGWMAYDFTITFAQPTVYTGAGLSSQLQVTPYRTSALTQTFAVVPEPATYALLGFGLLVVGVVRRKRG